LHEKQSAPPKLTLGNDYQRCFTRGGKSINTIEISIICGNLATLPREEDTLSPKKTYSYLGRQIPGQDIEFDPKSEPWGQYTLADGSEVKVKLILLNASRLDEFNEQGDPIYQFQFQHIVSIVPPENLKRKAQ
jgi:hypothetical protein